MFLVVIPLITLITLMLKIVATNARMKKSKDFRYNLLLLSGKIVLRPCAFVHNRKFGRMFMLGLILHMVLAHVGVTIF